MTGQAKSATLLAQLRAAVQAAITGTGDEAYLLSNQISDQGTVPHLDGLPTDMVYQLGAIASISALSVATGHWLQPESIPFIPRPTDTEQGQSEQSNSDPASQLNNSTSAIAAPERLTPELNRSTAAIADPATATASESASLSPDEQSAENEQLVTLRSQTPMLQQQLLSLQNELRSLHQQHGLTNIAIDVQRFAVRLDNLATQQITLNQKLTAAQQQQAILLQQLDISNHSQVALRILDNNVRYRALLEELNAIDQQLVTVSTQITPDSAQLQALQNQYQAQYAELNQEAQQSLQLYIQSSGNAAIQRQSVHLSTKMIEESAYLSTLQQAVQTAHQIQMLQMRQQTVESATPQIQQRQQAAIALMQQYRSLTQQIQTASAQLDQNLNQIATLQSPIAQANSQ